MRDEKGRFKKSHPGIVTHFERTEATRQLISASLTGIIGEQSRAWKGDRAGYDAIHKWLKANYDKGTSCEHCGTTSSKRLEWANVSGKYKRERSDFLVLCTKCHRIMDYSVRTSCQNGHPYTADNTRINKDGWRVCKVCQAARQRSYYRERKRVHSDRRLNVLDIEAA